MNVIETRDLTKRYGSHDNPVRALDGISFSVESGQIFGFLGPNGSGKTTTIGILLGIITASRGEVRLFGESGSQGLHRARQRVGATLETPNFYPYMSGRDNLRIVANVKGVDLRSVDEALELVGLTQRQRHRFDTYSLGMKQRLALAATLLGQPELIVLDEPANGLDPEGMREIRDIILGFAERGMTVFLSSHLLAEVERTCTHVAIISKGRIVKQSSVKEITTSTVLADIRGGDVEQLRRIAESYHASSHVSVIGDTVVVELMSGSLAELNQYVAAQGVYLSHLSQRSISLEDVFIDLMKGDTARGVA